MFIPLFIQKEMEAQEDERNLPKMSNLTDRGATIIKEESCSPGELNGSANRALAVKARKPKFKPWSSQEGGERELTPPSCPLTSGVQYRCPNTQSQTHTSGGVPAIPTLGRPLQQKDHKF